MPKSAPLERAATDSVTSQSHPHVKEPPHQSATLALCVKGRLEFG
jgi:hypothetical protein